VNIEQYHIAQSYDISESACFRNIKWIEDILVKSKAFSIPGRKALKKSDCEYEIVLIDAVESPIERPKKNSEKLHRIRKSAIHTKLR
jgi:hypothetical protein